MMPIVKMPRRLLKLSVAAVLLPAVPNDAHAAAPIEEIRIIAHRKLKGEEREYRRKEREVREDTHIPAGDHVYFLEVRVRDSSEFTNVLHIHGVVVGSYKILRTDAPAVPNAIAAIALYIRDRTTKTPHIYFGWAEGNPIHYLIRFILFGEGDIAPVTREVLRKAEPNPEWRPAVHVGG